MCAKILEDQADQFSEDLPAYSVAGRVHDETLEFDGSGRFLKSAKDGIRAEIGGVGVRRKPGFEVADKVVCIGVGKGDAMALFRPLANELSGGRQAFQRDDCRNIFGPCGAEKHSSQDKLRNNGGRDDLPTMEFGCSE